MRWDSISFAHFVLNITGEINISPVFFQQPKVFELKTLIRGKKKGGLTVNFKQIPNLS